MIPNPPEDLQVVPDIPLDGDKEKPANIGSAEVDRKPFLTIPENGEKTPNSNVS